MKLGEELERYSVSVYESEDYPDHVIERYTRQGHLHRMGLPALIMRDEAGNEILREYYSWGRLHRMDGPASIWENEAVRREEWYAHGMQARHKAPAFIDLDKQSNVVIAEHYCAEGQKHRSDGPAVTHRNSKTGQVTRDIYYKRGQIHRLQGPAVVEYDEATGLPIEKSWYKNGKLHRDDNKPAQIKIDSETEKITSQRFFLNGIEQTSENPKNISSPSPA